MYYSVDIRMTEQNSIQVIVWTCPNVLCGYLDENSPTRVSLRESPMIELNDSYLWPHHAST